MTSTLNQVLDEFTEAGHYWNLEKLYIDLASAKGKGLTPVEKKILRGLLCGYSPSEIATTIYHTRRSSSVRVYLSNYLYKYLECLRGLHTDEESIKINHWSRVITLLEKIGYKEKSNTINKKLIENTSVIYGDFISENNNCYDWGEAIDVGTFYGREEELVKLENWIITEGCRLVSLNGLGGIGKTALSVRIAQKIQDRFGRVIWRSLHHPVPLEKLLINLIKFLSPQSETERNLPETLTDKISQLIECLRQSRCLVIIDNVDSVLQANTYTGNFQPEYENYGELFKRLGEISHQSCWLLTSREKIKQISSIEGVSLPVHCLNLNGLKEEDCQKIMLAKGINCADEETKTLIKKYAGNPLALKLALTTIQELFSSDVNEFLKQKVMGVGGVSELLDNHLNRLSEIEMTILQWLAIEQELNFQSNFQDNPLASLSKAELIEVLASLSRRSLIYKNAGSFQLQPMFKEYLKEQLSQQSRFVVN